MKSHLWLTLCLFACAGPGAVEPALAPDSKSEPLHVVVLHTNDVHGQVLPRPATWLGEEDERDAGGLPRVAAYVESVRRELADTNSELIVLDAGDWSQGTPEGGIDRGRPFVSALKRIDYDAMCLGNHEFDHGVDALVGLLEQADLPLTTANIVDRSTGRPVEWAPTLVKLEVAEMNVMVVGLVAEETATITHEDARQKLEFRDPSAVLGELQAFWQDQVHWWLPLTHLGHEADAKLARDCDVPLVVGGHSHQFLRHGVREGDSLIVQAGCKATVVGRTELWFDRETYRVIRSESRLIDLLSPPDPELVDDELATICEQLVRQSALRMDEVVGQLSGPLPRSRNAVESSPAGNLIADITKDAVGAQVGVMNRGGIRTDLPGGSVQRRALFEICPFDNSVVKFEMTGAQMFEFLRRGIGDPDHSGLEISGVTARVKEDRELVGLLVDGVEYSPESTYSVAMNSFMASGGDGFLDSELITTLPRLEDPRLLRELLEEHFLAEGEVIPDAKNRYELMP